LLTFIHQQWTYSLFLCTQSQSVLILCTEFGNVCGIEFDEFAETFSTSINIEQCILVINVETIMVHYIPQISDFINFQLNVVSAVELTAIVLMCIIFPQGSFVSSGPEYITHISNV